MSLDRYVKFWIDETHDPLIEEQEAQPMVDEYGVPFQELPTTSAAAVPVFGARPIQSRETPSPDRREGLTPGNDPGLNTGDTTNPSVNREGLTLRPDYVQRDTRFLSGPRSSSANGGLSFPSQRLLQKIKCPRDVLCYPWSHCESGSAKEQT